MVIVNWARWSVGRCRTSWVAWWTCTPPSPIWPEVPFLLTAWWTASTCRRPSLNKLWQTGENCSILFLPGCPLPPSLYSLLFPIISFFLFFSLFLSIGLFSLVTVCPPSDVHRHAFKPCNVSSPYMTDFVWWLFTLNENKRYNQILVLMTYIPEM